jgi:hypothetical protein
VQGEEECVRPTAQDLLRLVIPETTDDQGKWESTTARRRRPRKPPMTLLKRTYAGDLKSAGIGGWPGSSGSASGNGKSAIGLSARPQERPPRRQRRAQRRRR